MTEPTLTLDLDATWLPWTPGLAGEVERVGDEAEHRSPGAGPLAKELVQDNDAHLAGLAGVRSGLLWLPDHAARGYGLVRTYTDDPSQPMTADTLVQRLSDYKKSRGERVFDYAVQQVDDGPLGPVVAQFLVHARSRRSEVVTSISYWMIAGNGYVPYVGASTVFPEYDELIVHATATVVAGIGLSS